MQNYMHIWFIIFIVWKLILFLQDSDNKVFVRKTDLVENRLFSNPSIKYFLNDKEIPVCHEQFCLDKLDLNNHEIIDDSIINKAYYKFFDDVKELRNNDDVQVDIAGIKAVRSYMIDRWEYLAFRN